MIPQAAPQQRIARYRTEIDAAIAAVLSGNEYILGSAVEIFERAFATHWGVEQAVGVGSGTDALALALRALGVDHGDEVITTALTFSGTAQAILHVGAVPRFVDVDRNSRCLDPAAVAAAINSRTAAIMPVHLFGYPCDMAKLMVLAEQHGLGVVEDCAQAHGATLDGRSLGSFGHIAAFSFYPTKNLGAVGDGGAIVTNDPILAARVRSLRNYGFETKDRISQSLGFNSRLDEIQAAMLTALLPHLAEGNSERQALAARYRRALQSLDLRLPPESPGCVYHQFAIEHPDRDGLRNHLLHKGIGSTVHYWPALHKHPAFSSCPRHDLSVTEKLSASLLSLPIQPEVAMDHVETVAEAIGSFRA